jgi:ATP-dependent Clp protease protease subunit
MSADPVEATAGAAPALPAAAPQVAQAAAPATPETIYLTLAGDVNMAMVQRLLNASAAAVQQKVKTVHLLLHSTGGSVMDGVGLYNYLRKLPLQILTYNAGGVMSAAVLMYLAGSTRLVSTGATFLIHKSTMPMVAPTGAAELGRRVEGLVVDDERTEAIYREHLTLPDARWAAHANSDLIFTAQQAVDCKLATMIGDFAPPADSTLINLQL